MQKSNIDDFEVLDIGDKTEQIKELQQSVISKENDVNSLKELLEIRNEEIKSLKKQLMQTEIQTNSIKEESQLKSELLEGDNQKLIREIQILQRELQSHNDEKRENELQVQRIEMQVQTYKQEIEDLKGICQAMDKSKIGFQDQKFTNLENEIETLQSLINNVDADTYTQIILEKVRGQNQGKNNQIIKDKQKITFKEEFERIKDILSQNGIHVKFEFQ